MALKIPVLITSWKTFNLPETQQKLDETATSIAAEQDESESSKKKLVEMSREFKKNTPDDVRKQVAPLLKSFQLEIDNLNKRNKSSETAFLNVYKQIIEMADPLPALEYCAGLEKKIGKLADIEIENKNLRETLHEYNEEFKDVRNQDVTIKNLKDKLKQYEEQMNENIESKIRDFERELMKDYNDKEKLLQELQESLTKRLEEAESKAQALQQASDQTQSELFDYKSKFDESNLARADEMEMLMNDLERANQRALLAEKESHQLKDQIQLLAIAHNSQLDKLANSSNSTSEVEVSSNQLLRSSLEIEVASKDREISQLVEDIKQLQTKLDYTRKTTSKQIQQLEEELHNKSELALRLEKTLSTQKDYEEIQRELQVIKSIEFGNEHLEESPELTTQKPLEVLLLKKNKALQNENTSLKQLNNDLQMKTENTEKEISDLNSLVSEQKGLIMQLEFDLSSVHNMSSMYRGEGEGSASIPEIVAEAVRGSSNTESLKEFMKSDSPNEGSPPDFTSAAESLLPIVSSQRERFRLRNEELEAELTVKGQQVVLLQNELDNLRADNLKLYEKIRFLQSYEGCSKTESSGAETRYVNQYEESLDPFSSFSRKERSRKYAALGPFEKITLSIGKFFLSNKTARTITFIYTGMLHCLIFLVLYKFAHTESCKRDFASDCAQKFAEHMNQVHGHEHDSILNG